MCLNCGQVLCGRYENGHALHHSTLNTQHNVCLNTLNCTVYCYKCDDFVVNETSLLSTLREELRIDDSSSDGSNDESSKSTAKTSNSPSSSDSGWYDETTLSADVAIDDSSISRRLRPRKRTNVTEQEAESPSKKKKKVSRTNSKRMRFTCFTSAHNLNAIEFLPNFPVCWLEEPGQHMFHELRVTITQ